MKYLLPLCLLLAALLPGACTYSDFKEYWVEPVAGDSTSITINCNLDTLDQPLVTDSLMVAFSAEVENGALYYMAATLEQYLLHEMEYEVDRDTLTAPHAVLDTFFVPDYVPVDSGDYELQLLFYYSTNSNSLADYFGVEFYQQDLVYLITLPGIGE